MRLTLLLAVGGGVLVFFALVGADVYGRGLFRPGEASTPAPPVARLDLSSCANLATSEKRACFSEAAAGRALELAGAWVGQARRAIPGCAAIQGAAVAACESTLARQQAADLIGDAIVEAAIEVVAGCRDLDNTPWECVSVAAGRLRTFADTVDVADAAEALIVSCGGQTVAAFDQCVNGNEPVVRRVVKSNLFGRAS